jgi:hypothetical protein
MEWKMAAGRLPSGRATSKMAFSGVARPQRVEGSGMVGPND